MLLTEFRDILLTADPKAAHYFGSGDKEYTVWAEYGEESTGADDKQEKLFDRIQVDHYSQNEYTPMKDTISNVLLSNGITYQYRCYAENDESTGTRWIHHLWDCEVW